MSDENCLHCAGPLPNKARKGTKFCATRCRVAWHRAQDAVVGLPAALRELPRWVRSSGGKVPLTVEGRPANSMDPMTWSSYATAAASAAGVGLGFVLADLDDIACVDLDHCLDDDGRPDAVTAELLAGLPDTYVERSRGGRGLHVWGRARGLPTGRRRTTASGVTVEVYSSRRYIAVGIGLPGTAQTLGDITEFAHTALHA